MYGKALEMERTVLRTYWDKRLGIKTKTDTIVNAVEEYVAELTQTVVCNSEASRRGIHRCRFCGKIIVDDESIAMEGSDNA